MACPKPIVAAANGACGGMAVPIALSCDLRFMADEAVVLTAFAQRGLIAEWGLSWLLPPRGSRRALDLLFVAEGAGSEAAALGLVNASMPGDGCSTTAAATSSTSPPAARRRRCGS